MHDTRLDTLRTVMLDYLELLTECDDRTIRGEAAKDLQRAIETYAFLMVVNG